MTLYLDTTTPLNIIVRINDKETVYQYSKPQEQNILSAIDQTLKKENIFLNQITQININPGPGSFTGTRVGVALANALAFALNIPINGNPAPIFPVYAEEPRITVPNFHKK